MNTRALAIPTESTGTRTQSVLQTLVFTAVGVGTLFVLGKCISTIGQASGLPSACWQLTGARAAAATLVVGSMARFRVGHLALFGALYGLTMLSSHTNWTLVGSAGLAGVAAWLVFTLFTARRPASVLGLLLPSLAYTIMVTTSGFITAIAAPTDRQNLTNWSLGVAIRVVATTITVLAIWFVTRPRSAANA